MLGWLDQLVTKLTGSGVVRNVQILRAIAAFLVIFVHLETMLSTIGITSPIGGGGVDIFFVISGFIMVYTTAGRGVTPGSFIRNRITRIVPIYWLITLCVFSIALVAPALLQATQADGADLMKSLLFIPFVKSNGLMQPILFVGWTLNYEMFFYVIFAMGLFLRNKSAGMLGTMILLVCLVGVGAWARPQGHILKFYTNPIMLEFALGMLIGILNPRISDRASPSLKWATAVLVIGGISAVVILPLMLPTITTLLTCGLPATVVVGGAIALERWGYAIRTPLLLLLGNASYSIYLTHPFVTQFSQKVAHPLLAYWAVTLPLLIATVAGVGIVGVFVHRTLERPLSRLFHSMLDLRFEALALRKS